jgi:hypothetical protein
MSNESQPTPHSQSQAECHKASKFVLYFSKIFNKYMAIVTKMRCPTSDNVANCRVKVSRLWPRTAFRPKMSAVIAQNASIPIKNRPIYSNNKISLLGQFHPCAIPQYFSDQSLMGEKERSGP